MKTKIKNLKEAEHVLYELAGIQAELEKINGDADKQIAGQRKSLRSSY